MDHVAIMKKEWGLLEKILDGRKRIESRWYINKVAPWDQIKPQDSVYFKNSGEPATVSAKVEKVLELDDLNPIKIREIVKLYGDDIGIDLDKDDEFIAKRAGKRYCVLIFLKDARTIKPFDINKSGFGAMSTWITVPDIDKIKV